MDGELRVDPTALRDRASELDATARSLASGAGGGFAAPEWSAGRALETLDSAVSAGLGVVAGRVAHSAALLREAATAYESADERAAARLWQVR